MGQSGMAAALLGQAEWARSQRHADDADALLAVAGVYEAKGGDYWATLAEVNARIANSNHSWAAEAPLSMARYHLRRNWRAPEGVADPVVRKLHRRSEWERSQDRLDEADALLLAADAYEATGHDYDATLRALEGASARAGFGDSLDMAAARELFSGIWADRAEAGHDETPAPPVAPGRKALWPFGR